MASGGWQTSDRRSRLPPNWPVIRQRILRRDEHRCTVMKSSNGKRCPNRATEVDHIQHGDDHADDNLTAVCTWHHSRKSGAEGGQAAAEARKANAAKFRRVESHPGSLA